MQRAIAAILFAAGVAAIAVSGHHWRVPHSLTSSATVKVELPNGHGSGVYIGGGHYLTAAHVVDDAAEAGIRFEKKDSTVAEVQWSNKGYDIALLYSSLRPKVAAAPIRCADPTVGDEITVVGNPLGFDSVTTRGRVAKGSGFNKPWRSAFLADIAVTKGNSGGPAFNPAGEVVGIVVGVAGTSFGLGWTQVGLSFIVPGSTVCMLMGRA